MTNKKEIVAPDYSREPDNYEQWRSNANAKDTRKEIEFYNTPPEKVSDFIKKYKKWWSSR